jgi:ATP phosphoribosyltransferase
MGCRPKDMAATIARGLADGAVTYNTVAGNQPPVLKAIASEPVPSLRLCLIGRKGDTVTFPSHRKTVIAAEHPVQVSEYLRAKGMPDSAFKIQPVLGSSESYLVNNSEYDLCDAVVETGKTLDDNDLVIRETVLDYGAVTIGFYVPARA